MSAARNRFRQIGWWGCIAGGANRLAWLLSNRKEVVFYEWSTDSAREEKAGPARLELEPLTLETLARAALELESDSQGDAYVLRAARRLRAGESKGFALLDEHNNRVHFCWIAPFEGFYLDELSMKLEAPSPNASLIFDCWTPSQFRGRGLCGRATSLIAEQLLREGRAPWIFSDISNQASIRASAKTNFEPRYSVVRHTTLMSPRTKISTAITPPAEGQGNKEVVELLGQHGGHK